MSENPQKTKSALITGASRGIGRAIALKLSAEGYNIGINFEKDIQAAAEVAQLAEQKNGCRAILLPGDVSDYKMAESIVKNFVKKLGQIDVLVNNVGIRRDKLLVNMEETDWDRVLAVNLKSAFNCSKFAGFEMVKQRGGRIVNISSVGALWGPGGQGNYVAAKGALISLTKTLARELSRFNIIVNAVAPGFIETDMTTGEQGQQMYLNLIPLGRFGRAEEVAEVVSFLVSEKLSYTTGHVFYVDGGLAFH